MDTDDLILKAGEQRLISLSFYTEKGKPMGYFFEQTIEVTCTKDKQIDLDPLVLQGKFYGTYNIIISSMYITDEPITCNVTAVGKTEQFSLTIIPNKVYKCQRNKDSSLFAKSGELFNLKFEPYLLKAFEKINPPIGGLLTKLGLPSYSTPTPSSSSYRLYEFTTDYNITYPGYKPKLLTGYSEGGYYNTKPDGSGAYSVHESYIFSSYLDVCDKYGVNYYEPATTIPIYCQWEPKILVSYDTIFNYYDWYRHEIKPGHATTIVSQNEIGFTIKTNNGGSDGYSNQSPSFKLAKENGQILQEYTIDVDVNGSGWQLFIFFYNDADNAVYYSNGYNHTSITSSGSKITIPTGATKAQIRVDSNESNNQVSFYNFRIYKYYPNMINCKSILQKKQQQLYSHIKYIQKYLP